MAESNIPSACLDGEAFIKLEDGNITPFPLNDIKIGFSNGHPEMDRVYSLEEIDDLLDEVIVSAKRSEIKERILFEYGQMISSTTGQNLTFIEQKEVNTYGGGTTTYLSKNIKVNDRYEISKGNFISIPGVILNVSRHTLRTPSLVVDALLGQGEALDCFAMKVQDENTKKRQIENQKEQLILDTLSAITDPVARAEAMAKIFNPVTTIVQGNTTSSN